MSVYICASHIIDLYYNICVSNHHAYLVDKLLTWHFENCQWYCSHQWLLIRNTQILKQENTFDYGIFAMAFTYHCAYDMKIQFIQADMQYFRQKIIVTIELTIIL